MEKSPSNPKERFSQPARETTDEPEVVLWTGAYSGRDMTAHWIVAGLLTVGVLIAMLMIPSLNNSSVAWWTVAALTILGWLSLLAVMVYRKLCWYYEVTNQRLKHREGILFRKNDRIEMIDVDDVTFRQGPIEALMGVGNIIVKSSDASHPELRLRGIANVRQISNLIDNARRVERRKRGMYIESV
jgi:membrane protein YdbS with pleckstrin-like domain